MLYVAFNLFGILKQGGQKAQIKEKGELYFVFTFGLHTKLNNKFPKKYIFEVNIFF